MQWQTANVYEIEAVTIGGNPDLSIGSEHFTALTQAQPAHEPGIGMLGTSSHPHVIGPRTLRYEKMTALPVHSADLLISTVRKSRAVRYAKNGIYKNNRAREKPL
jgi:hypothetical protein